MLKKLIFTVLIAGGLIIIAKASHLNEIQLGDKYCQQTDSDRAVDRELKRRQLEDIRRRQRSGR